MALKQAEPRPIQKILIVGAGAVGGYFGGRLFRSGVDVTFLVRSKTYEQISRHGLQIKSIEGDFLIHPPLVQHPSEMPFPDLIILAVKCYDVASVLAEIAPLVEKGSLLLTLQNGVLTEGEILSYYQKACVLAGVAFITARLAKPGVIEHSRRGIISLGECSEEKSERALGVYALLSKAGIECYLRSNILRAKWEKLCWNATFNPLSVILDHPISLILETPSLLEIVRQGISEVIAVAGAEGVDLNPNIIDDTISASVDLKDFHTSMYEDFRHGKPTEIEYLNGDLMRRGKANGIATPTHQMLYALVKGLKIKRAMRGASSI